MGLEWLDPGLRAISALLSLQRETIHDQRADYPVLPAAAGA
jgi:hypothetical protein